MSAKFLHWFSTLFVAGGLVMQALDLLTQLPGDAGKAAGAIMTLIGVVGHLINAPNVK